MAEGGEPLGIVYCEMQCFIIAGVFDKDWEDPSSNLQLVLMILEAFFLSHTNLSH